MRRKNIIMAMIPVLAAAFLAAGCGKKPQNPVPGENGNASETQAEGLQESSEEPETETEPAPPAEPPVPFEERDVPVFRQEASEETVTLRFYEDCPHVAYVSFEDYHRLFLPDAPVEAREEEPGSGIWVMKTGTGEATADIVEETLYSEDLPAFTNVMSLQQEGMENAYYDGAPYIRWAKSVHSPEKAPVTLDFAAYGIDIRADENGIFFPVATLADIYADLDYHLAFYNGDKVYVEDGNHLDAPLRRDPEYDAVQFAQAARPEDLRDFNYRELCFAIDHFYGFPGRSVLEDAVREKGLDAALRDLGPEGTRTAELIQSPDLGEYMAGMDSLGYLMDDAGHTDLFLGEDMERYMPENVKASYREARKTLPELEGRVRAQEQYYTKLAADTRARSALREQVYGSGATLAKEGDTAVCVFDSFNPSDYGALKDYLSGDTHIMPGADAGDPIVTLLEALETAAADPEIRNFVIDISNNQGGSVDLVVTAESLLLGSAENGIPSENTLTGQRTENYYDVDRNFNGAFDAADQDVDYGFRYAVLISDSSFSSANLFASVMRDHGVLILGEQSGGGTCAIQNMATADGFMYRFSSARMRLLNQAGEPLEEGVPVDVDLVLRDSSGGRDYREFCNIERFSREIDEWYLQRPVRTSGPE